MRTIEQQRKLLHDARAYSSYDVSEAIRRSNASPADKEDMRIIVNATYNEDSWAAYLSADTAVRDFLMDIIEETRYGKKPERRTRTLTRAEIIAKVEHEIKFQRMQAGEYESGVHKDEVTFARYDQAAKILEWVLGLLKEQEEQA